MSLVADPVAVKTDMAVGLNKSRINLESGGVDNLSTVSRETFSDLYDLSAVDQDVSYKSFL